MSEVDYIYIHKCPKIACLEHIYFGRAYHALTYNVMDAMMGKRKNSHPSFIHNYNLTPNNYNSDIFLVCKACNQK